jgi:membrane-bound lytic murein transglycosylase B
MKLSDFTIKCVTPPKAKTPRQNSLNSYSYWLKSCNRALAIGLALTLAQALLVQALPQNTQFGVAFAATGQASKKSNKKPALKRASQIREDAFSKFDFLAQPEVQSFIEKMQSLHGFEQAELNRWLGQTKHRQQAIQLMTPPTKAFKRSWVVYRSRYLDALRVNEGIKFWQQHKVAVTQASEKLGVPPEIMVAIIGVETVYGRVTGDFRVMDALATLAFDYPRRAAFFKEELEQFLLLAREQKWDPLTIKGSFAGAIGYPQFMPGSIRRHAIDFSGDGRIDLLGSPEDAIGSVANFLVNHGWQAGQATHYSVRVESTANTTQFTDKGIKPEFSARQLSGAGISFSKVIDLPDDTKLSLIELATADRDSEWIAAANNFYVITRYNQSSFYAMAVIDLATELKSKLSRENTSR